MDRKIMPFLVEWKNSKNRKPLLIKGARQVGKTWLMKTFGDKYYKNIVYIDFHNNEKVHKLFQGDINPFRIIDELSVVADKPINADETLIIFDEIQECSRALSSLKYFCEDARQYHIVAAGSFLGVSLHENDSFPVGKTDSLALYPLSFSEFLDAIGANKLNAVIEKQDEKLISAFKNDFIKFLKYYYYIGGMPEVVSIFSEDRNFKSCRRIQKRIIDDYQNDFLKHIGLHSGVKVEMLWNEIPKQLAKENKKFVYSEMKPGAKSRDFRSALFWLVKSGLVYMVNNLSRPSLPLLSYQEQEHFKLYMLDIGLLSALTDLDISVFFDADEKVFNHFKGALSEQYVLQELKSLGDIPVFYWSKRKSTAEIDFVIQSLGKVIPIEVKSSTDLRSKSLKVYIDDNKPKIAIRTSLADARINDAIYEIPLFEISNFERIIKRRIT
jgi:predicted AAA+ superfamily ATPase